MFFSERKKEIGSRLRNRNKNSLENTVERCRQRTGRKLFHRWKECTVRMEENVLKSNSKPYIT